MFEATAIELPFMADLPKREKSRLQVANAMLNEIKRVTNDHGVMVPLMLAAHVLGVSKQRIIQLMDAGILMRVEVENYVYVTENSLVAYAKSERKAGRPRKAMSEKETMEVCREYGQMITGQK